jgi:hypothetical protein
MFTRIYVNQKMFPQNVKKCFRKTSQMFPQNVTQRDAKRHCERSEAIHNRHEGGLPRRSAPCNDSKVLKMNCRVAPLLAMTVNIV